MEHNQPDITDLRIFCAAVRYSSFSAAAAHLGISPTYVSKRIAGLERQLGIMLFRRTTRHVQISDHGELVYTWARRVLDDLNAMSEEISASKASLYGPLRISTSLRLGRNHVAPALSALKSENPKLEIWLELVDHRLDLISEEIDIDIRVGEVTEPHLIARRIVESKRILCAAPSYIERYGQPTRVGDLAQHQCLQFRDRLLAFGTWRLEGTNGHESVKITGLLGSNQSDIVRQWAIDGHGIIMLSDWDIMPNLEDGSMVRILAGYHQTADVWAVSSAKKSVSAKVRVGIDYLIEQLKNGPSALRTTIR